MLLVHLPKELLLLISEVLTEKDVNSLCRTCDQLYSLLNSSLYRYNSRYSGSSALFWAAKNGLQATALLSIRAGGDVEMVDDIRHTPLSCASTEGHEAIVKLFLGSDIVNGDSKDFLDRTPLSYAAENGHTATAKLLCELGDVNVNAMDSEGWTPLFYAAGKGHAAVVKLLLDTGKVIVSSRDAWGNTPL